MTNVGEVNVKLGLNSDEFVKGLDNAEKEIEQLEKNLKKSKSDFEKVTKAIVGTKQPSKELTNTFKELKNKLKEDQKAFDDFNNKLKKLDGGLTQTNPIVKELTGALGKLAGPTAAITAAKKLYDLGKAAVDTASKFEQLEVSFEVLAGGADAGKRLTDQIIELAAKTPLTTEALSDGARTLLSFGEASDEVVNDLKLLGDITGGDTQRMQSLTLAFAQVGSTGKLMGQDLLQMVNAGFNPLSVMSEKTGKSIGQLKDEMSKGLITFQDVKQAMIDATSEGGRFYGMMNKQSETLEGRLSTLDDTWQLVSKNMGDMFLPIAKKCVEWLIKLGNAALDATNKLKATQERARLFANNVDNATLSVEELNKKLKILSEYENNLLYSSDKAYAGARHQKDFKKRIADIEKEKNELIALYKARKQNEPKNVKEESKGFLGMSSTGTDNKEKKTRDKALDEYKKYIEQYNKLNNDYQGVLKAREYVEKTLNLDPITQQQDYDKAVELYKNYFSKMQEIAMSGAKNKAELQKLEEQNLARELQEIEVTKAIETQRKLYDIQKGYQQQAEQIDLENNLNAGFFGGLFGEAYTKKLELEKWYQTERQRIIKESNNNIEAQEKAFSDLEILRNQKIAQDNINTWQQYGQNVSNILNSSFSDIISGNENFSDAMKALMSGLYQQLIKMAFNAAMKEIEIEQMKQTVLKALRAAGSFFGGIGGAIGGLVSGVASGGGGMMYQADPMLPMYHSGGIVPGTKEQLARVKGGERILNPAENAAYTNGEGEENIQGGVNNIMMFNIKAWDGKDVIQTLKANSQTINQIVSSGIKNNNQGLRTTVQNI